MGDLGNEVVPIPFIGNRQSYKMASAMPAHSNEKVQLSQRTCDRPEPATIARDRSLQSTKGTNRLLPKEFENLVLDFLAYLRLNSTILKQVA